MPRIVITAPGRNPQPYRFQLDRQSVTLGRGSENDIVVDDGSVSVSHAAMERIEGGYQLRDLGSTNGIKLEGKKAEIIPLRHGLSVKVGDVSFDFTLSDDERAALHREKPLEQSPIIKEDELEPIDADAGGPRRAAAAVRVPAEVIYQNGTSPFVTFLMTLLFLALAGTAFFVGLSLRYSKDKGGASLLKAYKEANTAPATPETPAPAPDSEVKKPE